VSKESYPDPTGRAEDTLKRLGEISGVDFAFAARVQEEIPPELIHPDSDKEFQVLYMARRLRSAIANKEFDEIVAAEAQLVINKYVAFDSFRLVLSAERKAAEVEKFIQQLVPFMEILERQADNNNTAA
jgi:hypothetical protein